MTATRLRTISAVCYILLLLVVLSALHRVGIIRFALLFILAAVGYYTSVFAHYQQRKASNE